MSWEDFDVDAVAEEPDFGETTAELSTLAPETKPEPKTLSNKELKEQKKTSQKPQEEYVDPLAGLSEEEKLLAMRRIQEEADMKAAHNLYGNIDDLSEMDKVAIITDKDYIKYGKLLGVKGHALYKEKSKQYKLMVKECLKELVADLPSSEINEIASYGEKGGKKSAPSVTVSKKINDLKNELDDDDYYYEEEDDYDFM
ncbi:Uncharacterized protein QTN25_006175 [Entamoeba marina]